MGRRSELMVVCVFHSDEVMREPDERTPICQMKDLSLGGVHEMIGFGIYQSCGNRGSVGRMSVFGLRWCEWCRWGVGWGLDQGLEGWCYVGVRCGSGFSV